MMARFISEESGQGAIEYILVLGGALIGAIGVGAVYADMAQHTAETLNSSVDSVMTSIDSRVMDELAGL